MDSNNSTILIVDDTPENIDILSEVLKAYKRKVATNGERALKIANSSDPPNLILLDIMMPAMDGYEVCRRLKAEESTKNIPVIFITAKSEVEDETKGLELGAVDFIAKPISPPIVLARVRNQLELLESRLKLEEQNHELESRNQYITDSINYAKKIQTAILPPEDYLRKVLKNHFMIYKPKDIVSGDFYWVYETLEKIFIAVVDCTGHGVPGSMMSMIGNTLLNEIVTYKKYFSPAEILNELNDGIINELNKESNTETYDGMDLSFLCVEKNANKFTYAAAYRPLFYSSNCILNVLKGDRKSIGERKKKKKFTEHTVEYDSDILIYMFTDGIIDQNNSQGVKFGTRQLKEELSEICSEPLSEQKDHLSKIIKSHMGNEIQRDDITVLGLELKAKNIDAEAVTYSYNYEGLCSNPEMIKFTELIEKDIEPLVTRREFKTILFVSNEIFQNVGFYSADRDEDINGNDIGKGRVELTLTPSRYTIISENLVSQEKLKYLQNKIEYYNTLDEEQLKSLYKQLLKAEQEEGSKGGGIGTLEIVRKSKNPLRVELLEEKGDKIMVRITAIINLGEANG